MVHVLVHNPQPRKHSCWFVVSCKHLLEGPCCCGKVEIKPCLAQCNLHYSADFCIYFTRLALYAFGFVQTTVHQRLSFAVKLYMAGVAAVLNVEYSSTDALCPLWCSCPIPFGNKYGTNSNHRVSLHGELHVYSFNKDCLLS